VDNLREQGQTPETSEFLKQLVTDPGFKEKFIVKLQETYQQVVRQRMATDRKLGY
jgi:hypothetical protein